MRMDRKGGQTVMATLGRRECLPTHVGENSADLPAVVPTSSGISVINDVY